jgi:hypothetical protein
MPYPGFVGPSPDKSDFRKLALRRIAVSENPVFREQERIAEHIFLWKYFRTMLPANLAIHHLG